MRNSRVMKRHGHLSVSVFEGTTLVQDASGCHLWHVVSHDLDYASPSKGPGLEGRQTN